MSLLSPEQIATALKSVPLFAGLEKQQVDRLAQRAVPRRAEAGTLLFAFF